jgi:4-amino-4-deoxy-L-arabinose transferase-like glycosyltransferase
VEDTSPPRNPAPGARRLLLPSALCLLIFLLAFGARLLMRQEAGAEVGKVQTAVTNNYRHMARLLADFGVRGFFSRTSPTADPDTLGHPPGYPVVIALAGGGAVASDSAIQLTQIAADSLAAVVVFLLAFELLSLGAAAAAGLLVALAPQFVWNSVLLLPDTLAVLPLLVAVYLVALALRRPRVMWFVAAGVLVGLSCWLRANALLLAPFLAAAVFALSEKKVRTPHALALVAGALLSVAPLTVRNAYVFGAFIPVSLGAGQTLLEGIADYDEEGRFGIPATDLEIQRQEAAEFARADYAETLFGPDAVARERRRLARARAVILRHPFWFASVMAQRAASMLRLERTPRLGSFTPAAPDASGALSPARTRLPRAALALLHKMFITAVMLPLALAGLVLLAREKKWRALALLAAVPVYYLCVQSALHTEYRYVLAVHYFLFVAVAFGLSRAAGKIVSSFEFRVPSSRDGG